MIPKHENIKLQFVPILFKIRKRHTAAFRLSQEKYEVKKHGSFPSVILYSGTCGDNPSNDTARFM